MIKNVHGNTVEFLGRAIVAGRYVVGGVIPPEPLLCEELGVSRTVVRESVKSLVAKGLIQTGPKVGTRVLPSDSWNWFDAAHQARGHGEPAIIASMIAELLQRPELAKTVDHAQIHLVGISAGAAMATLIAAAYPEQFASLTSAL